MMYNFKKFTLVELLIVIAVITVLFSLLTPSLYNARKKAMLAVCLSNQAQIGRINTVYAVSNDSNFVYRKAADSIGFGTPYIVRYEYTGKLDFMKTLTANDDDRSIFIQMGLSVFNCPFNVGNNTYQMINQPKNKMILFPYSMYFGWRQSSTFGLTSLNKSFIYKNTEFNIASSDILHNISDGTTRLTHPYGSSIRYAGVYSFKPSTGTPFFYQDTNFCRIDGSGYTERKVTINDSRFMPVPYEKDEPSDQIPTYHLMLPKKMR